ncbi:MAG: hypothetical protein K2Q06_06220 [Parvularculaceae bacterium]|nr:hypothetical protein [Parvularculaceae bacterium]
MTKFIIAAAAAAAAFAGVANAQQNHAAPTTKVYEIVVTARTGNDVTPRYQAALPANLFQMGARAHAAATNGFNARMQAEIANAIVAPALPLTIASL